MQQAQHINPFLQSATTVLEQMCSVTPSRGELTIKHIEFSGTYVWLKISIFGQLEGDIVFGFPEQVALRIVSGMMGGFSITEFDEMSQSAIAELGNMISGNASSLLYDEGIQIDITPPMLIRDNEAQGALATKQALSIPLTLEGIGQFEIFVVMLK
ncbi:chemotaxis protein CheX [Marinicrinis sediminis]|uniref:Chemotaxis protein CheX n=1 Tax=Marinicrinis sediminis TaxID=1652465 RepID=A0ABW5R742_9BACL